MKWEERHERWFNIYIGVYCEIIRVHYLAPYTLFSLFVPSPLQPPILENPPSSTETSQPPHIEKSKEMKKKGVGAVRPFYHAGLTRHSYQTPDIERPKKVPENSHQVFGIDAKKCIYTNTPSIQSIKIDLAVMMKLFPQSSKVQKPLKKRLHHQSNSLRCH